MLAELEAFKATMMSDTPRPAAAPKPSRIQLSKRERTAIRRADRIKAFQRRLEEKRDRQRAGGGVAYIAPQDEVPVRFQRRPPDSTWFCSCGERCGTLAALHRHRQERH